MSAELAGMEKKSAPIRYQFVLKIKKQQPSSDVEVWSMDEHRLRLKPGRDTRMGE
jgi:hypothetical protein